MYVCTYSWSPCTLAGPLSHLRLCIKSPLLVRLASHLNKFALFQNKVSVAVKVCQRYFRLASSVYKVSLSKFYSFPKVSVCSHIHQSIFVDSNVGLTFGATSISNGARNVIIAWTRGCWRSLLLTLASSSETKAGCRLSS